MRKKSAVLMIAAAGFAVFAGSTFAGTPATGIWKLDNGKVTVKVSPCGGNLCGTVIGLKKPRDDKGRPRLDKENPDKALRSRPVIGLTILSNMKPDGNNRWNGTIYNPDDGNTYRSRMKLQNASTMKVEGCIAVFCKAMKFIRVE
jgi:uncharacterized protein (DUF2147 family)